MAAQRAGVPKAVAPPVRLTRRGRGVLLALLILVLCGVATAAGTAGEAAGVQTERPSVVVEPGDTLWRIAQQRLPRRDRIEAIEEIRRLNHLPGYSVTAGQRLVLPRSR